MIGQAINASMQRGGALVFFPYSGLHLVSVVVSIVIIATVVLLGRMCGSKKAEVKLRRGVAIFVACYFVGYNVWCVRRQSF